MKTNTNEAKAVEVKAIAKEIEVALIEALKNEKYSKVNLGKEVARLFTEGGMDNKEVKTYLNEVIQCEEVFGIKSSTCIAYGNCYRYVWVNLGEDIPFFKAQAMVKACKKDIDLVKKAIEGGEVDLNANRDTLKKQLEKACGLASEVHIVKEGNKNEGIEDMAKYLCIVKANLIKAFEENNRDMFDFAIASLDEAIEEIAK